jgi:hypothetical protein
MFHLHAGVDAQIKDLNGFTGNVAREGLEPSP